MPNGIGSWKRRESDDAVRAEIKRLQSRADVHKLNVLVRRIKRW